MRRAATRVSVFQWPTLATNRWPLGARPYSLVILVVTAVSSMNTRREGFRAPCWAFSSPRVQSPVHRGQSFRRIADSNPVIADSF